MIPGVALARQVRPTELTEPSVTACAALVPRTACTQPCISTHEVGDIARVFADPHSLRRPPRTALPVVNRSQTSNLRLAERVCDHAREQMHAFVDGELVDHAWLESHLRRCPACAGIEVQLRAQRARLQQLASHLALHDDRAPESLVQRVRASMARESA